MRASAKRMLSFVLSLLFIAGSVFVYVLLISPAYSEIQVLRGDLVNRTETYNNQKAVFDKIKDLNDKYKGSGSLQEAVSLAMPNEPFISQIVSNIQGLANLNNRMPVLSLQTEVLPLQALAASPSYIKNIGTVKVTLQMRGQYQNFKKFISDLEHNYRILNLRQFDLKTDSTGLAANEYIFSLTLNANYQSSVQNQTK